MAIGLRTFDALLVGLALRTDLDFVAAVSETTSRVAALYVG